MAPASSDNGCGRKHLVLVLAMLGLLLATSLGIGSLAYDASAAAASDAIRKTELVESRLRLLEQTTTVTVVKLDNIDRKVDEIKQDVKDIRKGNP
jgi:hypothetical protein